MSQESLRLHSNKIRFQTTRYNYKIRLLMKSIFNMIKEREEGWIQTSMKIDELCNSTGIKFIATAEMIEAYKLQSQADAEKERVFNKLIQERWNSEHLSSIKKPID